MSRFRFLHPEWHEMEPSVWLVRWATRYGAEDEEESLYSLLIDKRGRLSGDDLEQVGRWKEGCLKQGHGSWKTGTPKGYDVWIQAKAELTVCPEPDGLSTFLEAWAEKTFAAGKRGDQVLRYRFGLSRATTLLHFVSGGRYPIFDSRIASALVRLGAPVQETIDGYLTSFCPLFTELATACGVSGVDGLRKLDNALFAYGADTSFPTLTVKHTVS